MTERVPKLKIQKCDSDGKPEGKPEVIAATGFWEGRPMWRFSSNRYIHYGYSPNGNTKGGGWCLSTFKNAKPCFHDCTLPCGPQAKGASPPEGPWKRVIVPCMEQTRSIVAPWEAPPHVAEFYLAVLHDVCSEISLVLKEFEVHSSSSPVGFYHF